MPQRSQAVLEPRKAPVQARSVASVEAILDATVQVLVQVGKDRLTTTRVAARAGVSVGTLYQYFPNKSALLQAVLTRHLEEVFGRVERVCAEGRGRSLREMATGLMTTFLEAKLRDPQAGVALYAVSADVDGARIAQRMAARYDEAIAAMLRTASEPLKTDPGLVASVLQGAMAGVSRRLVESRAPETQLGAMRGELVSLACAYLEACAAVRS